MNETQTTTSFAITDILSAFDTIVIITGFVLLITFFVIGIRKHTRPNQPIISALSLMTAGLSISSFAIARLFMSWGSMLYLFGLGGGVGFDYSKLQMDTGATLSYIGLHLLFIPLSGILALTILLRRPKIDLANKTLRLKVKA
jgi:hypothetical protein